MNNDISIEKTTSFKSLFENSANGIAIFDVVSDGKDFMFKDINPAAEKIDLIKKEEVVGKLVTEIFPNIKNFSLLTTMRNVYKTGVSERHPTALYKDLRITGYRDNYVFKTENKEIVNIYYDRTEEKQIEESLIESEKETKSLISALPDLFFKINTEFIFTDVKTSKEAESSLLMPVEEIIGKKIENILPPHIAEETKVKVVAALSTKKLQTFEYSLNILNKDRYFEARIIPAEENVATAVIRDITEQKIAEKRQKLLTDILLVLNSNEDLKFSVEKILDLIKGHTGFYAVGIRLKKNLDYPYITQKGFTVDFIKTENSLFIRDENDSVCLDVEGNPILVCTCGAVISGNTDPNNPLYTKNGSAWYNGDSKSITSFKDIRTHPRNRCLYDGFNSIALIPIKADNKIVGLLQLNDYEPNKLTLDRVEFFEKLTSTIGIALIRKQTREALIKSEERFRNIAENVGEVVIELDGSCNITFINKQISNIANYTVDEMLGTPFLNYLTKDSSTQCQKIHNKMIKNRDGSLCTCLVNFIQKNGIVIILEMQWKIVFGDGNGNPDKITTYIIAKDVTIEERKKRKDKEEKEKLNQEIREKLFSIETDLKSIGNIRKV